MVSVFINWIWSAPLLVLVISWILYDRVGWPPLIGVAIILIVVPVQCEKNVSINLIVEIKINDPGIRSNLSLVSFPLTPSRLPRKVGVKNSTAYRH